ncbi:T9SS type A sorting domain-containing protein [uncultured Hymenobacter sp.]|uniref:T9SS type A sorting domain-containing protein n=1 Tax=uncultured Hymenobacter sp. TaxID=170016 RepID=UPI0035CB70AE
MTSRLFGTGQLSVNPQLTAAYLNRDGFIDFAYTYDNPNQGRIKWDAGNGGRELFGQSSYYEAPFTPTNLTLEDFDRDGNMDVVTANTTANEIVVISGADALRNGPQWFNTGGNVTQFASGGSRPVKVATGDLNGDNQPDLAVAHAGSNELTVFLNLGSFRFGSPFTYRLSGAPRQVMLQDLNGDGYPELLALTADNKLQVFQHTQAGGTTRYGTPLTFSTGLNPTIIQLADMDGDYVTDIVVGCEGDNTVRVYLNKSLAQPTATRAARLAGVEVFPNPATHQVLVRVPTTLHGSFTATLMDQLGRTVRQQDMRQSLTSIPVADLARGLYVLRLTGEAGTSSTRITLE